MGLRILVIILTAIHLLCDLYLEGSVRVPEVGLIVFNSLISAVEAVSAAVAVPVGSLEPLLSFDGAHNLTMVAASKHY